MRGLSDLDDRVRVAGVADGGLHDTEATEEGGTNVLGGAIEELEVAVCLAELLASDEEACNVSETAAVRGKSADGVECGARTVMSLERVWRV